MARGVHANGRDRRAPHNSTAGYSKVYADQRVTILPACVAGAQGLRVPHLATGLEGTANPAEDLDDFTSPACAFFIDGWIFEIRETPLSGAIKVGTVMMTAGTIIPQSLRVETELYSRGWELIKNAGADAVDQRSDERTGAFFFWLPAFTRPPWIIGEREPYGKQWSECWRKRNRRN